MRLADFIEQHLDRILEGAIAFARTQAPAGVAFSEKELRNHLPEILKAVVGDLRTAQTATQQHIKSEGRAPAKAGPETAATYHGRTRAIAGFGINQMIAEYRALRAAVLRLWAEDSALVTESIEDLVRFNEAIDQAVAESLAEFSSEVESWRQIFLGALGHDLRGPLTAVVFSADVLASKLRETPHARQVDRILAGGLRMTQLLDDLLRYSRSKLGDGMVIHAQDCELAPALAEEAELLRAALPDTTLHFESHGDTHGRFDTSRVREALHNLATNAAKYGEQDTAVTIQVKGQDDHVLVAVTNHGAPLSDDARRVMFDPLRRGSNKAKRSEEVSLGLGLFLVREIARAHGGSVDAESADGLTTFSILLPRDGVARKGDTAAAPMVDA